MRRKTPRLKVQYLLLKSCQMRLATEAMAPVVQCLFSSVVFYFSEGYLKKNNDQTLT